MKVVPGCLVLFGCVSCHSFYRHPIGRCRSGGRSLVNMASWKGARSKIHSNVKPTSDVILMEKKKKQSTNFTLCTINRVFFSGQGRGGCENYPRNRGHDVERHSGKMTGNHVYTLSPLDRNVFTTYNSISTIHAHYVSTHVRV